MVWRKRCAVMVGRPAESTKPAAVQAALRDKVEQERVGQQLAAHQEHMLNRPAGAGVEYVRGVDDVGVDRHPGEYRRHAVAVDDADRAPLDGHGLVI